MAEKSTSEICIFCTCCYTTDGKPLPFSNPQVLSIQQLAISVKIQTNRYRWMRDAGFIWLSVDEFRRVYDKDWKDLIGKYSQHLLRKIVNLVETA